MNLGSLGLVVRLGKAAWNMLDLLLALKLGRLTIVLAIALVVQLGAVVIPGVAVGVGGNRGVAPAALRRGPAFVGGGPAGLRVGGLCRKRSGTPVGGLQDAVVWDRALRLGGLDVAGACAPLGVVDLGSRSHIGGRIAVVVEVEGDGRRVELNVAGDADRVLFGHAQLGAGTVLDEHLGAAGVELGVVLPGRVQGEEFRAEEVVSRG